MKHLNDSDSESSNVIWLIQILLIVLKLTGAISSAWWAVMLPIELMLTFAILSELLRIGR
ncbi:hypothetical protein HWN39_10655 [Lactobacillus rhamnosus]|uniref:Uncharacterized protein n=1 Tax=Lacticaseibacillus rhamnosus TaxID=47715 RepID=A0A7Y7QH96_LACRH|nr:hypothetical protein [Lacticaseibacillus rhamnosus]NVO88938.1 hypothetical protein [Lacticaseibacillus rhamnosus]